MADNEMPDDREPTDTTGEPSLRAAAAFDAYYAMGPMRSLRKLAAQGVYSLASLERWSSGHGWQQEARARHQEEVTAARDAARKEAANHAVNRMKLRDAAINRCRRQVLDMPIYHERRKSLVRLAARTGLPTA